MPSWYYLFQEQTQGPVEEKVLVDFLVRQELSPDTPVWTEGMPDWVPASQIDELRNAAAGQPEAAATAPTAAGIGLPPQPHAKADFREAAVRESLRLLEANGGAVPDRGSYCLPVTDTNPLTLRRYGYCVIIRLVLGLLGLGGGALLAALSERPGHTLPPSILLAIGGCFSVGGILILMGNLFFQGRFVRKQIGTRYNHLLPLAGQSRLLCISVEDAATFKRMKFLPEDLGFLGLDPSNRIVWIEGVRFRYRIAAEDVSALGQVSGSTSTATGLAVTIGKTSLQIALHWDSLLHELKRQTIGTKSDPLLSKIQKTLNREPQ